MQFSFFVVDFIFRKFMLFVFCSQFLYFLVHVRHQRKIHVLRVTSRKLSVLTKDWLSFT